MTPEKNIIKTRYTAEETVFGIPELRRYILGFYLEKKIPIVKQARCCVLC